MKKNVLLTLLLLVVAITQALSQSNMGSLAAKVVDAEITSTPIIGASVEILPRDNDGVGVYYSTDINGSFSVPSIVSGYYRINISYLGYEKTTTEVFVAAGGTVLPDIAMKPSPIEMETVVKEISLRASQSGDSLRYNASAYKVTADADVEGLIQKMPGISIEDGKVSAQGEEVKKIYIDGKEFFGNDVTMALKSLPAEVVDKIELYDKKSDEAEASGMDDGNSSKSINIVTKPNMREGLFGKVFAGVGYEPEPLKGGDHAKYLGGGSVNLFSEQRRITVIGMFNNLNQQNFSFEDIMGVEDENNRNNSTFMIRALPGVANVNAFGLNYTEDFGEKGKEKVKVQASYFFNKTTTTNYETLRRWYEAPATDDIDSLYQEKYGLTESLNNRINSRIDIKINDRKSILIRPELSFQTTEPYQSYDGVRYEEDKYESNGFKQEYSNSRNSVWGGLNLGTSAYYRLRLNNRRNFSVGGGIKINRYDSDSEVINEPNIPSNVTENTYRYETSPNNRRILFASANFLQPITKRLYVNLGYNINQTYQKSDKNTYQTEENFIIDESAKLLTTDIAESNYVKHNIGPGFRYYKGKTRITGNVYYQLSNLESETTKINTSKDYETVQADDNSYKNVTYNFVSHIRFNKENSLRIYLNSYTYTPPISRFIDNTSNNSYIVAGNPDLKPTYSNRLNLRYIRSDLENGSTFMIMLNALKSNNFISPHVVLNPEPFKNGEVLYDDVQQYTTWVNLDDYWQFNSNLTYGMPLNAIKCNLNLSAGVGYTLTPSIYGGDVVEMGVIEGGDETTTDKMSYRAGVSLGSNISKSIDFTLSWNGDYNDASSATATSESQRSKNLYFNHTATAAMKFVFGGGFTFTGNASYKQYLGITNNYNDRYVLCNAFLGHKVLHRDLGEINIGINDILNENTDFRRSVGNNFTQNIVNSTLGRYVSVQFIYNLRYFRGNSGKAQHKKGREVR